MSIARSTPAQNERGAASTTLRGPMRSAHRGNAGASRRRVSSARAPEGTVVRRANGMCAVSTMTRTTATGGRPGSQPIARTTAADSMSTASAPVLASFSRSAPVTILSQDTIGPVCTRRPMRRNSATSGDAARSTIRPCSSRTSLATTTSPGRSDGSSPPATPATTRASGAISSSRGSHRRTRSGPMPHRSTVAPGTRPTSAAYSVRRAATTSRPLTARPPCDQSSVTCPTYRPRALIGNSSRYIS